MRSTLAAFVLLCLPFSSARSEDGARLFDAAGCRACHRIGLRGGSAGPDLTLVGHRRPRAWLARWLQSPRAWKPDTLMPEQGLSDSDRNALADDLSSQRGQSWGDDRPWRRAGDRADAGRVIYLRAGCVACHGPSGRGGHPNPGAHGDVIPALAPLMSTYTADELKAKIRRGVTAEGRDGMTPVVAMPPWKDVLTEDELDALTKYLLSLDEGQPKSDW